MSSPFYCLHFQEQLIRLSTKAGTFQVCKSCWWDHEGEAGQVGAWFTGRNELPDRTWQTRSQIVAAGRAREFAWIVGGNLVRWGITLIPIATGTVLTESWHFLPGGIVMFEEKFGDDARAQIADRTEQALEGFPKTLQTIQRIVQCCTDTAPRIHVMTRRLNGIVLPRVAVIIAQPINIALLHGIMTGIPCNSR